MFLGSGAMAYVKTPRDSVCSYGGLVYAYDTLNIRFWRPTSAINGGLICVSHFFGNGTNSQLSTYTEVVIRSWGVDSIRNTRTWKFEVPQNTCRKPTRIPVE
ncbi:uncharacterized protein LOC128559690 [Mercenaria mercenaria]|uniref:uncharacterized protein LOC128559690 n=1 Tax=Mercenaria mercenaria TaxID=6596 RepID=UPI00234FA180|nr:uncharacterized protein LOC128559690 [Mercenaria mercenaria]